MAITLTWGDEAHTLLWCRFTQSWTWQDFERAVTDAQDRTASVNHTVDIVVHALASDTVPPNAPFSHFEGVFLQSPLNTGLIVIISEQPAVKAMLTLANKFYNLKEVVYIVGSVAEASTILNERSEKQKRKQLLIEAMGSRDNQIALRAAEQLKIHETLFNGEMHGVNLSQANLRGASLSLVDLQQAQLPQANLHRANLYQANLYQANLQQADLQSANLNQSNLSGADLRDANLRLANLTDANLALADLRGADLSGATLGGADLTGATFDETTRLPSGQLWTPAIAGKAAAFSSPDLFTNFS